MSGNDVVRAAIPGASDELCSEILWSRTPFPFGEVTARSLYRAASGFRRAAANKISLCLFCNRPSHGNMACERCDTALSSATETGAQG